MTSRYLFDSHALLAFFQEEKGTEVVAKILRRALKQRLDRLICVINLGEIIYMTKRRFGDNKKVEILGRVHQLGFKILPAPEALVYKAAELRLFLWLCSIRAVKSDLNLGANSAKLFLRKPLKQNILSHMPIVLH